MNNTQLMLIALCFQLTLFCSGLTETTKEVVTIPRARCTHYGVRSPEDADAAEKLTWLVLPKISDIIRVLMHHEQIGIDAAFFRFTHEGIAESWAYVQQQTEHPLKNRLVIDASEDSSCGLLFEEYELQEDGTKKMIPDSGAYRPANRALAKLVGNGIDVWQYTHDRSGRPITRNEEGKLAWDRTILHHKFMVFHNNKISGKSLVITGSYNATTNADEFSWENIVILTAPKIVAAFMQEFYLLVNQKLQKLFPHPEKPGEFLSKNMVFYPIKKDDMIEKKLSNYTFTLDSASGSIRLNFTPARNEPQFILDAIEKNTIVRMNAALEIVKSEAFCTKLVKNSNLSGTLIVDSKKDFTNEQKRAYKKLIDSGWEVRKSKKLSSNDNETMHNKFVIFYDENDKAWICASSGHPNEYSNKNSWENMVLLDDSSIVSLFEKEFELLKSDDCSNKIDLS